MKAILHLLDHSLPLQSGYTFRTRAILKAQLASGWMVEGLTGLRQYQNGMVPGPDHESVDGLAFWRTPRAAWPVPLVGELREVLALAERAVAVRRQFPYALIHAHSPVLNGLAGLIAARRTGVPFLYEIRAFWEDAAVGNGTGREGSMRYRATHALESFVCRHADAVAVICEGLKRDLVGRGIAEDKIFVSPNGVDMELFGTPPARDTALAAELGLGARPVLGFIGSFYDYEGLDDLIAAMPLLAAAGADADLLLVGGGPREAALREAATASSAAARIHFVGRVPHGMVDRYYSLIDVLVYPRKRMRLTDLVTPLKPLEAMAQGRLVAASDVGGHRELIADGDTGVLFAPDDPAALAAGVAALIGDSGSWGPMRERARAFVERERDWGRNVMRYGPVYDRLVDGARAQRPAITTGASL